MDLQLKETRDWFTGWNAIDGYTEKSNGFHSSKIGDAVQRDFHSALFKYEQLLSTRVAAKADDGYGSCRSSTNNFFAVGGGVGILYSKIFYAKLAYYDR